jgi:glutathione S-transferase
VTVTLYSIAASHPGLAVHGMLARKRIDHRVVDLWPGMQPLVRAAGFPRHTVPALLLGDGRKVQGSRPIARALEEVRPEPPLFPAEPERRARVEAAERWGDEDLQEVPRRLTRWMAVQHEHTRVWLAEAAGVPFGGLLARPAFQARWFANDSGADGAAVQADLAALPAHLAEIERLRAEGTIGGAEPNVADFQIAASLRALEAIGDLAPLTRHPAFGWAASVLPPLPGPLPPGLPAEWLEPVRATV